MSQTTYISEELIKELSEVKIVSPTKDSNNLARTIIRKYLIQVHENAVSETLIACNKKAFVRPQFYDTNEK